MSILIFMIMILCMSFFQDRGQHMRKERVFETFFKDSVLIQVDLIYNEKEQPCQYYSHVQTPVCEEGLCYLVIIDLYWDLLGNFMKYELPADAPLTKFDHIEFTKEDHEKMYEILSDKTSFLRDYAAKDLIESEIQKKSETVVDGVSGATSESVKDAVVSGAVYSSHTLWHIVNGQVAEQIVQHTEAIFSDSLLVRMLKSDNYHYQFYALNKIPAEKSMEYLPYLIRLISGGGAYVPYFAIEKLPEDVWKLPEYQETLVKLLGEVDFKMQNELLNKLEEIQLSEGALDAFITNLEILRENQIIKALKILSDNQAALSYESMLRISPLLEHQNMEISHQTYQILQSRGGEFEEIKKKLSKYENLH